jgi:hypothetical protein
MAKNTSHEALHYAALYNLISLYFSGAQIIPAPCSQTERPGTRDQVSHPYRTTAIYSITYSNICAFRRQATARQKVLDRVVTSITRAQSLNFFLTHILICYLPYKNTREYKHVCTPLIKQQAWHIILYCMFTENYITRINFKGLDILLNCRKWKQGSEITDKIQTAIKELTELEMSVTEQFNQDLRFSQRWVCKVQPSGI